MNFYKGVTQSPLIIKKHSIYKGFSVFNKINDFS